MASGAVEMMLRCVFDGCLSMQDMEIERRPYHRNCSCQLHKSKGASSINTCPNQRNVSFPMRHSWTSCSLSMAASNSSSACSFQGDLSNRNREDTSRLEEK